MDIGNAKLGMIVAETLRRNKKNHQDDQNDRADQRQLHVVHRFTNRLGAVEENVEFDGLRNLRRAVPEEFL